MITKAVHPELLDELPTLKKAIEKEEIRTKQLNNAIDELNDTRTNSKSQKTNSKLQKINLKSPKKLHD